MWGFTAQVRWTGVKLNGGRWKHTPWPSSWPTAYLPRSVAVINKTLTRRCAPKRRSLRSSRRVVPVVSPVFSQQAGLKGERGTFDQDRGWHLAPRAVSARRPLFTHPTSSEVAEALGVTIAAVSLVALSQIGYESLTLVPMIGLGIAWASMIGLPSMMVSTTLPKKQTGVYLGVLNMMIVIPTLAETLTFGWIFKNLLGGSGSTAILLSGILLGCAGERIAAAQALARKRPREVTKRGSPQKWRDRLGGATKGRRYRSFHGHLAASGLLS